MAELIRILHRDRPAVRVDVASRRFSRLVICVPEGGDAGAGWCRAREPAAAQMTGRSTILEGY